MDLRKHLSSIDSKKLSKFLSIALVASTITILPQVIESFRART